MKVIEMLEMLSSFAGDYYKKAVVSIATNQHMNDITKEDLEIDEATKQRIAEAVIVDFINYIGAMNCVDYAMYTRNLPKELEKNEAMRQQNKKS